MNDSETRSFHARQDQLAAALGFVEAFCIRHGVALADTLRLTLVVEELFTNAIVHGHRGDSDAPLRIGLGADATRLRLHFEDEAPPFDPLRYLAEAAPDLDRSAAERRVGGLGLRLVAEMSERLDYERVDGCNRLRLSIRREG